MRIGVGDEDIGIAGQPLQGLAAALSFEVQHDAPLVGIEVQELAAGFGIWRAGEGSRAPGRTPLGGLDDDDVGAQIGHGLAAHGGCNPYSLLHDGYAR